MKNDYHIKLKTKLKSFFFIKTFILRPIRFIRKKTFIGSKNFWENNYKNGGNSGSGSYNQLAEFKASIINTFVAEKNIITVIEFGCGDGNQLTFAKYPNYIGLDISPSAISICIKKFNHDPNKSFFLYDSLNFLDAHHVFQADLVLSLDVIYHLIEDEVYLKYLSDLFNAANKFVIIYSSNFNEHPISHVKHRKFTDWIEINMSEWKIIDKIENTYKYKETNPENTSLADFYIYKKEVLEA